MPIQAENMRKIIEIEVARYNGSDLLVAFSNDLEGLLVSGRSEAELHELLPGAIKDLLEASGHEVHSVITSPGAVEGDLPSSFSPPRMRAEAELCDAH